MKTTTPLKTPLRCRLGLHKYTKRINPEDGQRYHACRYCERMDPRSTSTPGGNGYVL